MLQFLNKSPNYLQNSSYNLLMELQNKYVAVPKQINQIICRTAALNDGAPEQVCHELAPENEDGMLGCDNW